MVGGMRWGDMEQTNGESEMRRPKNRCGVGDPVAVKRAIRGEGAWTRQAEIG